MPTATASPTPTVVSFSLQAFTNGPWLEQQDPQLASSIKKLDWIQDGIDDTESEAIQNLLYTAVVSRPAVSLIISLGWMQDGIADVEAGAIDWMNNIASAEVVLSVVSLSWMQDGIAETEVEAIKNMSYIANKDTGVGLSIISLSWMQDGITETELEAVKNMSYMSNKDTGVGLSIISLGWMQDGITETELGAIDNLANIAQSSEAVARLTVDMPWFADDITKTELEGLKYLSYIAYDSEATARQVADMPWFVDGITETELGAIVNLAYIAQSSEDVAELVVDILWFADGITELEVEVLDNLSDIAHKNKAAAERIAKMPFLSAIEPADVSATGSLADMASFREDAFEEVIAHPSLASGITDALTPIVTTLYGVAKTNPSLIELLLNSDSASLERRSIKLPLAGDVDLVIIRTRPGAAHFMDMLEYAARSAEELMGLALPTRYVGLLFEDAVSSGAAGNNFGSHIAFLPKYDAADATPDGIAHEVAHYYWSGNAAWVDEGVASFMGSAIQNMWTGEWVDLVGSHCPYAQTISELEMLTHAEDSDSDEFDCNYSLGERLFVDMYHAIGEESFWQGLRELYIESLVDDGDLRGTAVNIGHLREAFRPVPAASVVIARWYDGTESYDLTQLDLDPVNPTLPSMNGRIDEAYIQIGEDGPKVSSFSAQDVGEHTVWLNMDYSYNVTGGPHSLLLDFVEFYEDGFQFRRGTVEVTAEDQYTDGTSYIPVHPEQWVPGRYWVYIYDGDRKVAEVQYEVTP